MENSASQAVEGILEKAMARERLSVAALVTLLEAPFTSADAHAIVSAANAVTRREAGDQGMIGAQIGVNVEPCSMNCEFCSFGKKHTRIKKGYRLTEEQTAEMTSAFLRAGVNYVSLMATADLSFEEFLRLSAAARSVTPPEMMLSANVGDFGQSQARELKSLGFGRVYHPVRLGEGVHTKIRPERRVKTLEAAASENLEIAYCIEPIGPEHTPRELAEMMDFSIRFRPTTGAVMRRIPVEGTVFAKSDIVPEARMAQIMAVMRLAYAHTETRTFYVHEPSILGLYAGANLICAETAANPRELEESTRSVRGFSVARCREFLYNTGYAWRERPNFPGSWFAGYRQADAGAAAEKAAT